MSKDGEISNVAYKLSKYLHKKFPECSVEIIYLETDNKIIRKFIRVSDGVINLMAFARSEAFLLEYTEDKTDLEKLKKICLRFLTRNTLNNKKS